MKSSQKALIIKDNPHATHGLDELNVHLSRGWRVAHLAPMGAAATDATMKGCFAAIVIIERVDQEAADVMLHMEEEVEEWIDEIMESEAAEGDGATVEVEEDAAETGFSTS